MSFICDISSWDFLSFFGGSAAANPNPPAVPTKPKRARKPKQQSAKSVTSNRAKTKRDKAKQAKANTRARTQRAAAVASKRQSKATIECTTTTQSVPESVPKRTEPIHLTVATPRPGALTKSDVLLGLRRNVHSK